MEAPEWERPERESQICDISAVWPSARYVFFLASPWNKVKNIIQLIGFLQGMNELLYVKPRAWYINMCSKLPSFMIIILSTT